MSTIGLVVFRNKALQESAVNNSINISNNNGTIDGKKKEIVIVRKKTKTNVSQTVSVTSLVKAASTTQRPAKRARSKDDGSESESGRTPAPLAVARRNARERNRVRQVNNGFAELRRHIPDEVAESFETINNNRGPNKKLSKVETLRMAVDYIRSLESLLNINGDKENTSHSYPSPASSSPGDNSLEHSYFSLNSPMLDEEGLDDDELESLPAISHHYARITTADSFHLAGTPLMYEDDESAQPLTPTSDMVVETPFVIDNSYQFINSNEQFCVIGSDAYEESSKVIPADDVEIKYSDAVEMQRVINGAVILDDAYSSEMMLNERYSFSCSDQEDSRLRLDSTTENFNNGMGLKQEIPELDVTPEDRQQFEETLKWWQEKTQTKITSPKTSK